MRALAVSLCTLLLLGLGSCGGEHRNSIQLPVADDPTISFAVWFKVGSQNDPPGKEGLAYLTGQLIAEGSTTENSYQEILEKLYPLAASYSVRVDREMTTLTGRTHKDNLDAYYSLLTDAYLRPAFVEADFERIKTDTINYLEKVLRYSSDEELGKAALYEFVFEDTPYAHLAPGTVAGLQSISVEDVKNFHATHYTRDNIEVAIGGGFDRSLAARLEESLNELPEGVPEVVAPSIPGSFEGRQVLLVSKPDADASISFGFPIDVHRGEPDFYALWVANSWLGEHRNQASHLFQVIRETRGLNYGDYSYIEVFPEGGSRNMPPPNVSRRQQIFEVWIRTLPSEQAHFALRAAVRELQLLVDVGMTQEEFELTRKFLTKYVIHFADTTQTRLGYAVDDRFYGIDAPGHLARFRQSMSELTLEDVNLALKTHLQYERLKIAIVTGEAESLKQALLTEAPSPMVYGSEKDAKILEEDMEIAVYPLNVSAENIRVVPVEEMFAR
ncbi:MAG: pitrilysin family protein [Acidobacteriota bacterium]